MGYECDKCKILIVEDELLVRKALRYIIERRAMNSRSSGK